MTPDSYRDDRCIPMEWVTLRAIKYAIDYQPYDFDDTWLRGYSMYSKDFWHLTYKDIRDFKIKISPNQFQPTNEWWGLIKNKNYDTFNYLYFTCLCI